MKTKKFIVTEDLKKALLNLPHTFSHQDTTFKQVEYGQPFGSPMSKGYAIYVDENDNELVLYYTLNQVGADSYKGVKSLDDIYFNMSES